MENFDWTTFTLKIAVKSDLASIYDAWSKPCEITRWFLSKAVYLRSNDPIYDNENVIQYDTYAWSWYLYEPVEEGRITEANGTDFIQFTFAGDCLVDIELKEKNEFIIVSLTQKNIPIDEKSKQQIRLGCESGWAFFLANLKSVYEGGLDLRNKNPELKGLLNN